MKPEIKKEWAENLRSGDYKQGQSYLHNDNRFCCLGVLCDMAVKAGVVKTGMLDGIDSYGEEDRVQHLPDEVIQWAGLKGCSPLVTYDPEEPDRELTVINDNGATFKDIADMIEASL